jgi:hypothetical protein
MYLTEIESKRDIKYLYQIPENKNYESIFSDKECVQSIIQTLQLARGNAYELQ